MPWFTLMFSLSVKIGTQILPRNFCGGMNLQCRALIWSCLESKTVVCCALLTEDFQLAIYLDIYVTNHYFLWSNVGSSVTADESPTGKHLCSGIVWIIGSHTCLSISIVRKIYLKCASCAPPKEIVIQWLTVGSRMHSSYKTFLKAFLICREI